MEFQVTNRVFTVKAFLPDDLDKIICETYTPPSPKFRAGILRGCPGTVLIYPNGSAIVQKCKTDELLEETIHNCVIMTGILLMEPRLVNMTGCTKLGRRLDLGRLNLETPHSVYEPELHAGLLFYIDNVSVICYHTGTLMWAGCKSEEQFAHVVNVLMCKFNK